MDTNESSGSAGYVVECFWPGVTRAAHEEADRRVRRASEELEAELGPLLYLGSLLVPEDEVVFLQFDAADADVCRTVAMRAGIDHERVVQTVGLGGGDRQARP
jgi:hypothetical protein